MKKIINGKLYSTETAESLGEYATNLSRRDFHYYEETLYRKRTGEFFLYGCGGPASRYAVPSYGGYTGGESILPMSYEAARTWAEGHLCADEYEEIFGEVVEDDSKTAMSFSLRADTCDRIKRGAAEAGLSLSAYLDQLVATYCK